MVKQYTLTLDGTAQRLSQVYASGGGNALPAAADDIPFRQLHIQADPANGNVVYVGAGNTVSSTTHGAALDPTQASAKDSLDLGPFESGPVKLSDLWIIGTGTQRVMVLGVPF